MSDPANEPGERLPAPELPARRRWQVGLRTLFLLMAAIAVWMAYFINRRQNGSLAARIDALVPLAHDLVVDDPKKIAIVRLENLWMDEDRWEIYLPDGRYRLFLATHGIGDEGLAWTSESAPLASGRHQLVVVQRKEKDASRVTVYWDGAHLIDKKEPTGWDTGSSSTTGEDYSLSEQLPPDESAILLRRRFNPRDAQNATAIPGGATDGVLLWIDRKSEMNAKHQR